MNLQTRIATLLVVGALLAGLAAPASPAAGSVKRCSGYADLSNRSKSFWTRAGAEQVKVCAAQLGTGPGRNPRRLTPLHFAALLALNPAVVAALLKGGADPNSKNWNEHTPLHSAAGLNRNPAVIAALLKGGADPNSKKKHGLTPLHLAAQHNRNAAVVTALLKGGADPNSKNTDGFTPLHLAAQHTRNPAVVAALLKGGADPNVRTAMSATPLHLAALRNKNPAVVQALLTGGADPAAKTQDGTPFDLARKNRRLIGSDAYRRLRSGANCHLRAQHRCQAN